MCCLSPELWATANCNEECPAERQGIFVAFFQGLNRRILRILKAGGMCVKKWIIALLTLALFCCGCSRIDQETPGRPRLVEKITASYHGTAMELARSYTDQEKMEAVLLYLRHLAPYGPATEETDPLEDSGGHIVLHYSDGTTRVYELYASRYLRIDDGPWQNIKTERGQELPLLLGMMESD